MGAEGFGFSVLCPKEHKLPVDHVPLTENNIALSNLADLKLLFGHE